MSIGNFKKTSPSPGDSGTSLEMQAVQTANFTAEVGKYYPIDTAGTSTGVAVTAPASPSAGDQFGITDAALSFSRDELVGVYFTLASSKYAGSSDILDSPLFRIKNQSAVFEYIDSTTGWVIVSGSVPEKYDGFPGVDSTEKTASFTAFRNVTYLVDTTSAAITGTINNYTGSDDYEPGEKIGFIDSADSWGTNSFTIDFDAFRFNGALGATVEFNESNDSILLQYVDDTIGFVLIAGDVDPDSAGGSGAYKFLITSNAHRDSALTTGRIMLLDTTFGHQDHSMTADVAITVPVSIGDTQGMNGSRKWGAIIIPSDCNDLEIETIVRVSVAIPSSGDAQVILYHFPKTSWANDANTIDMDVISITDLDAETAGASQIKSIDVSGSVTTSGDFKRGDLLFFTLLNNTGSSSDVKINYTIMGVKN